VKSATENRGDIGISEPFAQSAPGEVMEVLLRERVNEMGQCGARERAIPGPGGASAKARHGK
jgi:hypothetical protein